MDINNLVANISNVHEYTSFTHTINNEFKNKNLPLNLATAISMKKLSTIEIEYQKKYFENGAVCTMFKRLLCLPPSNTWKLLAKEFVTCLKFWINAVRKYLDNHLHWWSFLQTILTFIKEIYLKDPTIPDILIEMMAESLFDIASKDKLDAFKQHEILHCLNVVSAGCSREIRFVMRANFGDYFTKIASRLCTAGYFPLQYSSLEALVRWLVPRRPRELQDAAVKWFPEPLCGAPARELFCTADWKDFFQGARSFLNVLNESNGLVTSVICKRLSVGDFVLITGAEKHMSWCDISSTCGAVSVLVAARALRASGATQHAACDALLLRRDTTRQAALYTKSEELTLYIETCGPPRVFPSNIAAGEASDVTLVFSTRTDLSQLDEALRGVFGDKYQNQIDSDTELPLTPVRSREDRRNLFSSEEDSRFSHPVEQKPRRRFGICVRPKTFGGRGLVSPSTTSTTSLAQLHDKLVALPIKTFSKERKIIYTKPELSSVSEVDDINYSSMSTQNSRIGVCFRNFKRNVLHSRSPMMKAESDSEIFKQKQSAVQDLLTASASGYMKNNELPVTGSSDDSIIDSTKEPIISKNKNDIVDLLIQEALQSNPVTTSEHITENPINDAERSQKHFEDKHNNLILKQAATRKKCVVVSKSTTEDESNTEIVDETPATVNTRMKLARKNTKLKQNTEETSQKHANVDDNVSFNTLRDDTLFLQNRTEAAIGQISACPTMAKMINESSSETSENMNDNEIINEHSKVGAKFECNDADVMECLKNIIDIVCMEYNKCAQYFETSESVKQPNQRRVLKETPNALKQQSAPVEKPKQKKSKPRKKSTKRVLKKNQQNVEQRPCMMSTIIEQTDEDVISEKNVTDAEITKIKEKAPSPIRKASDSESNPTKATVKKSKERTTLKIKIETRKMRKLYSRKDDEVKKEREEIILSCSANVDDEEDKPLSELKSSSATKIPKNTATCYKEIESHRKQIRQTRSKKRRSNVEESPSPKTLKMNAEFDNLKRTVENSESITLIKKSTLQADVYNFTSDSDDEEFKKKKQRIQKRTSTMSNAESARPRKRKTNPKNSNDDPKKGPIQKNKNVEIVSNIQMSSPVDLTNERMRDAGTDVLNTSLIIEKPKVILPEIEETFHKPPEIEPETKKLNKKTKKTAYIVKKDTVLINDKDDDEGTVSPLPLLVVEPIPAKDKAIESERADMLQKFQRIYREEDPDGMNESNNTQYLIESDIERFNFSLHNDVTHNSILDDETCKELTTKRTIKSTEQNVKKRKTLKLLRSEMTGFYNDPSAKSDDSEPVIQLDPVIPSDCLTAHGDQETHQHVIDIFPVFNRTKSVNTSKEYLEANRVYTVCDEPLLLSQSEVEKSSSDKNCFVPLPKLTYDDFHKWIPSRKTSESCSLEINSPEFISTIAEVHEEPMPKYRRVENESSPECSKLRKIGESKKRDLTSSRSICESPTGSTGMMDFEQKNKHNVLKESHESSLSHQKSESKNIDHARSRSVNESLSSAEEIQKRSPIVSIARISFQEFDKWLPPLPTISENDENGEQWLQSIPERPVYMTSQTVKSPTPKYNTRHRSKIIKDAKIPSRNVKASKPKPGRVSIHKLNYKDDDKENEVEESDDANFTSITTRSRKNKRSGMFDSNSSNYNQTNTDRPIIKTTVISPVQFFDDCVIRSDDSDKDERVNVSKKKSKSRVKITKTVEASPSTPSTSNEIDVSRHELSMRRDDRHNSSSAEVQELTTSDEIIKCLSKKVPVLRGSRHNDFSSAELGAVRKMDSKEPAKCRKRCSNLSTEKIRLLSDIEVKSVATDLSDSDAESLTNQAIVPVQMKQIVLMLKEMNAKVLEKMHNDTEANINTRKLLHDLYEESQMLRRNQQDNMEQKYKNICDNIMKLKDEFWEKITKMKEEFWEVCKSSNDRERRIQENLLERADSLLRSDCLRQRAMVTILKKDTQAVFEHVERKLGRPNEPDT